MLEKHKAIVTYNKDNKDFRPFYEQLTELNYGHQETEGECAV